MADLKISALPASTTPLAGTEVLPVVQSSTTKQVSVANLTAGRDFAAKSIALTGVAATGYLSMTAGGTTTNYNLGQITNTGGGVYWGVDNNAGTAFAGSTAYSGIVSTSTATDLSLGVNGSIKWRISNATGNLVAVTAGTGIDFSATAGTGTSELLNDYEEGTWTPTILGGTTAGTPTYTSQVGSYTKIGRQVTLRINLAWSAISGSPTGLMLIGGLPFAYDAVFATFPISEQNLSHTAGTSLVVAMAGGGYSSTQFNLAQIAPATAFTALNIVTSGQVFGTVTYFV